jgi:uncharacterized protein (TIGR00159 family)
MMGLLSFIQNFIINFNLANAIDVLIVACLIYIVLLLVKQTNSSLVLGGFLTIIFLYSAANFFGFNLTSKILSFIVTFLVIIFIVVFRQELRRFFEMFAVFGKNVFSFKRKKPLLPSFINVLIQSIDYLVNKKIGALIIISGTQSVDAYLSGGHFLGGAISMPILLSIFDPSSPGHDGAVIIENNTIKRFAVHLPLAEGIKKLGDLGTRHRAGLGISEKTDALVIIISEERGEASVAYEGKLKKVPNSSCLQNIIDTFLKEKFPEKKGAWYGFITNNFGLKALSLVLSLVLWFVFVAK